MNIVVHHSFADIDKEQWRHLAENSPVATFFQTQECFDFYRSLKCVEAFVYGISDKDSRLLGLVCGYIVAEGGLLGRYFSRRAIVPGGALLASDIPDEAVKLLFSAVSEHLKRKAIYIEIRNYHSYKPYRQVMEFSGFRYLPHYDIHVDTSDEMQTWKCIQHTKQRQIRQAKANGVVCEESSSLSDIRDFYLILKHTYKTHVNRPLFPIEFFEKLLLSPYGKLLVVKHHGHVVGGMACAVWQGKVLYEWFVCGVEANGVHASAMATWAGLQYAAQHQLPQFDFMGAGLPDVPYGVRDFKMKFGGKLSEFGRFQHICHPVLYKIGYVGVHLLKWLP